MRVYARTSRNTGVSVGPVLGAVGLLLLIIFGIYAIALVVFILGVSLVVAGVQYVYRATTRKDEE